MYTGDDCDGGVGGEDYCDDIHPSMIDVSS